MQRQFSIALCLASVVALAAPGWAAQERPTLAFEENRGQLPDGAIFSARADGFRMHLTPRGGVWLAGRQKGGQGERFDLRLHWKRGRETPAIHAEDEQPGRLHYYTGATSADWTTDVRRYGRVRYAEVYRGIDVVYHDNAARIEYDFVVAPGSDPNQIAMVIEGANSFDVHSDGSLRIQCAGDEIALAAPVLYQHGESGRVEVTGAYRLNPDGSVGFAVGDYNAEQELVVDPIFLGYSTRLGGSGADEAHELFYGPDKHLYVTGGTSSADFLGSGSAAVNTDAFVAKISPDGRSLVYAAILGGAAFDIGWGITAGKLGYAYVAGHTESGDFPTLGGAYLTNQGNTDAFLVRLDPNGSMVYGTYYGGAGFDGQFDGGIDLVPGGQVYMAGRTEASALPTVNEYQGSCTATCAYVAGFATNLTGPASLTYSSYVGGDEEEAALDLKVDADGKLYVWGFTTSNAGLVDPAQGFQIATGDVNNRDHFLLVLDPAQTGASQRIYSTYIGGNDDESEAGDMTVNSSGRVWIAAETASTAPSFPIKNAYQPQNAGGSDGYVISIDTKLTGANSLLWSSFLGGSGTDIATGVAIDPQSRVFVTFAGSNSANLPLVEPLLQFDPPSGSNNTAIAMHLSADGQTLLYSTPIPAGLRAETDTQGRLYVLGSSNQPFALSGGLPLSNVGGLDLFIGRLEVVADTGLKLDVRHTLNPAKTGVPYAYRYRLSNTSDTAATGMTLTSTFPGALTEVMLSAECIEAGGQVDCDLFDLGPRENTPVYFLVQANSAGTVDISGSASGDQVDPLPGDNAAAAQTEVDATGFQAPSSILRMADFDAVANSFDIGEFSLDVSSGVLATPNGSLDGAVNFMVFDDAIDLAISEIEGQGEVAFGFVERTTWTPVDGDGSDLFGRDFNAAADRVFASVDARGWVSLYTAAAFDPGRLIASGPINLASGGVLAVVVDKVGSNAQVTHNGFVVAEGDPFTVDPADADPLAVGDDQVISVSFGDEFRGAAILALPEPSQLMLLVSGLAGLVIAKRRRERLR